MSLYHNIFKKISPIFRRRRMNKFADVMKVSSADHILDVGGNSWNWIILGNCDLQVTMVDVIPYKIPSEHLAKMPNLRQKVGNALNLEFKEGDFQIVFSNSVIEHVYTWENQEKFASEIRRVAGDAAGIWVQTPARSFFIEPHFLTIGLHWLPKSWQKKLLPWLSVWGWLQRPSVERVEELLNEIKLLTEEEFRQLFPDCYIIKEKFLGIFTKSYIAWRPMKS